MTDHESQDGVSSRRSSTLGRLLRLSLKEQREILRDRRTIITLVLMPLLLYPLLGVIMQKLIFSAASEGVETIEYVVMVPEADLPQLSRLIQRSLRLKSENGESEDAATQLPSVMGLAQPTAVEHTFHALTVDEALRSDLAVALADSTADLAVRLEQHNGKRRIQILYLNDRRGRAAADALQAEFRRLNEDFTRRLLERMPGRIGLPADFVESPVEVNGGGSSFSLKTFIPLMLLLMTMTGAVYPAIDLTAGERERGTLEALVAAPVPRLGLLLAKFVAVLTVALLTAIINLFAMTLTLLSTGMDTLVFGDEGLSWSVILQVLLLLGVFATFFSAVLLGLTSQARSFKEAQAYLIPLMLVCLAPGIFCLLPGVELTVPLALAPLVNIVLVGRDLFSGEVNLVLMGLAVVSTCIYGVVALMFAARVFGTDAILYGSRGSWSDWRRRPDAGLERPTVGQAMWCLIILMPLFIIVGSLHGRLTGVSFAGRLGINSAILAALFIGLPVIAARWNRLSSVTAFRMQSPPWTAWIGAVFLGVSLWPFAYEINRMILSPERIEALKSFFEQFERELGEIPLAWKLFNLALVPAICEEFFFRGFLLSGLRSRFRPTVCVIATAVLFGLFHIIVRDFLFFERFVPSALLGVALASVAVRTGSVWPGMAMHAVHNSFLLSIEAYREDLQALGIGTEEQTALPVAWLIAAGVVAAIGSVIVWWRRGDEH